MELLALNYPITTPRKAITGWTSLIWTLRYQSPGEFKLTTSRVEETMRDLPIGSMVALNEGEEVMMVDTFEINQDEKGKDQLIVSGQSFQGFMRYRIGLDNYGFYNDYGPDAEGKIVTKGVHNWKLENNNWNDADAAYYIMTQHLDFGVFNSEQGTIKPEVLPNLAIHQADPTNRRPYLKYLPRTDLLTGVQTLLTAGGSGMRSRRAIGTATNTDFIIYKGFNRAKGQSINPSVVLWHDQGHLLTAKYLISDRGYYNSFRIFPTNKAYHQNWVWQGETLVDSGRMGINYRDLLIDATEISSEDQGEVHAALAERQAAAIEENRPTYIMECTVAENIPYVFGVHYNMGDILTVVGDFGIMKNARVVEFVMTEDKNGRRASPGLAIFQ